MFPVEELPVPGQLLRADAFRPGGGRRAARAAAGGQHVAQPQRRALRAQPPPLRAGALQPVRAHGAGRGAPPGRRVSRTGDACL